MDVGAPDVDMTECAASAPAVTAGHRVDGRSGRHDESFSEVR